MLLNRKYCVENGENPSWEQAKELFTPTSDADSYERLMFRRIMKQIVLESLSESSDHIRVNSIRSSEV